MLKDVWIVLHIIRLLPGFSLAVVTINNNGYRGVEVVIHEDVPEDLNLLTTIKEMLKSSSAWLYNTTNKRAYFEEITIVLPSTWSSKPEYKTVPEDDYYTEATLRIGLPHPSYNHTPYTFQPGGCGEFGRFIHMTPDFIVNYEDRTARRITKMSNTTKIVGLAKIFIHEWYHLRYGVFNEFGTNDPQFPPFYNDSSNMLLPNVCPALVKGRLRRKTNAAPCVFSNTGKLIGDCTFTPAMARNRNNNASIMFMPQLPQANGPCEDHSNNSRLHNIFAPNEHNLKCNKRSIRNVSESGPDFRNGRNSPRDIQQTDPNITILHLKKATFPGYVLVLDLSTSMRGKSWEQLKDATLRAIKYKAKTSCPLGMVSFSDTSKIIFQLTTINDTSRNELMAKLPTYVGGYTAIGQGLLAALQVLGEGNRPVEKGKIILITDGEENRPPYIGDVTQKIRDANVIVYGLAFGDQASKRVEDLSRTTGGKGWLFNSAHLTQSLDSMLDEIFQYCGPIKDRPFINKNAAFKLLVGDNKTGMFHVETGSANRPTTIYITYEYPDRMTNDGRVPLVAVKSPGGRQYSESSPEYTANPNLKAVIFKINNPDPGTWTYNLKNQENNNIHLNLMITSENGNTNDDPIRVKSWISDVSLTYPFIPKIYAEVNKNLNPVLNATVIANVFKPNGDTIKVSLQDNGKGADAIAYDGIYSEFYTYFNGNGRYAIDITVDSNNGGAGISSNLPSSQNSGAPDWPYFFPDDDDAQGIPMSAFPMSDFEQVDEEFETSALYDPAAVAQRQSKLVIKKVEDFERFSTAGTFILSQWQPKDMIQPGWISDLKVTVVDKRNRTVSLEWTSAGDDMFTGNASFVDVRYHFDLRQLLNSFDSAMSNFTILSGSLQPSQPYQVQILRLQLPSEDHLPLANTTEMIYFAIRTVDEERNIGDVSSTAFANFRIAKAPPFKRSCNKYIQLVECSKSLPIQDLKSAFHEGKNILETYDLIAKYDNDCISTVEMKNSGNIPNHCWSAIDVALEDLRNKLLHPLVHQEEQVMNLAVQFGEEQIIKSLRSY